MAKKRKRKPSAHALMIGKLMRGGMSMKQANEYIKSMKNKK